MDDEEEEDEDEDDDYWGEDRAASLAMSQRMSAAGEDAHHIHRHQQEADTLEELEARLRQQNSKKKVRRASLSRLQGRGQTDYHGIMMSQKAERQDAMDNHFYLPEGSDAYASIQSSKRTSL